MLGREGGAHLVAADVPVVGGSSIETSDLSAAELRERFDKLLLELKSVSNENLELKRH